MKKKKYIVSPLPLLLFLFHITITPIYSGNLCCRLLPFCSSCFNGIIYSSFNKYLLSELGAKGIKLSGDRLPDLNNAVGILKESSTPLQPRISSQNRAKVNCCYEAL
jgi:hypothetical protein